LRSGQRKKTPRNIDVSAVKNFLIHFALSLHYVPNNEALRQEKKHQQKKMRRYEKSNVDRDEYRPDWQQRRAGTRANQAVRQAAPGKPIVCERFGRNVECKSRSQTAPDDDV
jgi:hypothetical protein